MQAQTIVAPYHSMGDPEIPPGVPPEVPQPEVPPGIPPQGPPETSPEPPLEIPPGCRAIHEPTGEEVTVEADLPKDFALLLKNLRRFQPLTRPRRA